MMPEIYRGRGRGISREDYVDFINYVFGFNGIDTDFPKLLPKLYRPGTDPAAQSFVVTENGKLQAAVGSFPIEIQVCGETLTAAGIGNMAVHPRARSKGYMKDCMHMALEDMAARHVDFSVLSGQRQRYQYFSYECAGPQYRFSVSHRNLKHFFRDRPLTVTLEAVAPGDDRALDFIAGLSGNYRPCRERAQLGQILCSWEAAPYLCLRDGAPVGYCVMKDHTVTEIQAADSAVFMEMVRAIIAMHREALFCIPPFQPEYAAALEGVCESVSLSGSENFSVLNYQRVIRAFLRLKAACTALPEGRLNLLIHGIAGDEQLLIQIAGEEITVTPDSGTPELELTHLEAMSALFAPLSVQREKLPDFAKLWFPLPLWLYSADCT